MPPPRALYYGWFIVAVAWIIYGFGISPAYYSWGNFSSETIADLEIDRSDFGAIFGLFTFMYSGVGIFVGPAMARWGIRPVMIFGLLASSIGFFYLSRADSLRECFIGFSILGGGGIGFATIVPCQTLGQNWFLKRRALAIAIIFTAGGIVGRIVSPIDRYILANYDWRTGWVVIGCISAALAVVAALFIRDTPEKMGLRRDGATEDEENATLERMLKASGGAQAEAWTAKQALWTPQFLALIFCGIAYAVPWGVVVPHMRLHLQDVGFAAGSAIAFTGTMALVSILGRVLAFLGDYMRPQTVLGVALVLEGLGCGGLLIAKTELLAYICVGCIGIGFGTAYISIPVVFSHFFGRQAFGVTSGVRITVTGIFNGLGPWITGLIVESTGVYTIPFIGLLVLGVVGGVVGLLLRHPGAPPVKAPPISAGS